jgi:hypothetical protein
MISSTNLVIPERQLDHHRPKRCIKNILNFSEQQCKQVSSLPLDQDNHWYQVNHLVQVIQECLIYITILIK